ncbi:hypothetical protein F2Q70_00010563 [Brassica cretica]|uniref:Uncharacterized protein n=1 Tax=Brassica cretica TaxID=69181 RepID=A0A8S9MFN7_BRACR|nr:hypothetical protein F2Q70_00010563 [Brassica cretica]
MLFSIDIGITLASSLLRGYTKLEPLTIAEMSSSSLPSHRISPSYAPVGALGSRWTKAGVTSLSPCVQRSFSGLYHPSLVSCVACNNTNVVGVLSDMSVTLSLFDWQAISFHNKLESLRLFSIDIGIPPASSLLRGYTKLEPLTIAEMSSSSLPSHRISTSYAPVGALGSRWTKAGVTSLSPCVQRSFSGLYHPSLVSCVACNNTNVVGVLSIDDETAEGLFVGIDGAGEGVNSEEEEARWRAEREAAEREVARMSIADETAEGLFVGIDGAGEGVNSEEEEARWRAEREAAEREVARVRMRQELERELTQKEEARWRAEREAAEREVARVRMRQE